MFLLLLKVNLQFSTINFESTVMDISRGITCESTVVNLTSGIISESTVIDVTSTILENSVHNWQHNLLIDIIK